MRPNEALDPTPCSNFPESAFFNRTNIDTVEVSQGGYHTEKNPFFSTSGATFNTDHDAAGYPRLDTSGLGTISFTFTSA